MHLSRAPTLTLTLTRILTLNLILTTFGHHLELLVDLQDVVHITDFPLAGRISDFLGESSIHGAHVVPQCPSVHGMAFDSTLTHF